MINLYTISLFVHVVSIATLFGGISLMAMVLRDATRSNEAETMSKAMEKVQRWNLTMFVPTSVLILLTGIYMLMKFDANKPLWLLVKERFGSLVIVLFIVFVVWYGKKLLQGVKASGTDVQKAIALVKRYIMILNLFLLFMIILIFFVTTKLS
jgi:protoporphyrinogen IX oxidase